MAKNSVRDYSATNSSNTEIQSIDISEGCSPAGINNAIREVMADLKDVSTGAIALETPAADSLTAGELTVNTTDQVLINHSGDGGGIRIDSTNATNTGSLRFGDVADNYIGAVEYNHSTDAMSFYANNATRMTINSAGNVGIGTNAPHDLLHVKGNSGASTDVSIQGGDDTNDIRLFFGGSTNAFNGQIIYEPDVNALSFNTAGTDAMRIDSSGRLIINDTNPSGGDTLTVYNSTIGSAQYGIQVRGNAQNYTQYALRFYDTYNTSLVGSITYNTSSVSYNTSSDYRLKENVTPTWDATTRLKQLNPVQFNFIAEPDVTVDGFLAHEVQDIVPEAINGTKDAMRDEEYEVSAAEVDADGNVTKEAVMGTRSVPEYQGIDQSKLVPLLVKTILELEARITALEAA